MTLCKAFSVANVMVSDVNESSAAPASALLDTPSCTHLYMEARSGVSARFEPTLNLVRLTRGVRMGTLLRAEQSSSMPSDLNAKGPKRVVLLAASL